MPAQRPGISEKRRTFFELHRSGCFVIPNPWDVGSARFLQSLGFKALATTSSGFAWSQGRRDGGVTREQALSHLREIVAATDVPVNADYQSGFGREPADVRLDLEETLARLKAYAGAGADCLYAPGIRTREQIAAVVAGVAPKPVNLLVGNPSELTVTQIAALGVRRISVGGALARSAWGAFMRSARLIAEQGRFDGFGAPTPSHQQVDSLF